MTVSPKIKSLLGLVLKIGVSAAAIAFVVYKIDLETTWATIKSIKLGYVFLALLVYALSQVISAMRINTLFVTIPLRLDTIMNIRLYWLGMFYNFLLPGGVGGDGYKIYYLKKHYGQKARNLVKLLLGDRISGLVAICCYLLIFTSFFIKGLPIPYREWFVFLVPLVVGGFYFLMWIFKRDALPAFWKVLGYSFLIQALQMSTACIVLFALGETSNFDSYMFLFFVSSIASAIPVTLAGGIGAREMAFVIGSEYLATNESVAVSLSLCFYLVSLVSSIPGLAFVLKPKWIERSAHTNGNTDAYCSPDEPDSEA